MARIFYLVVIAHIVVISSFLQSCDIPGHSYPVIDGHTPEVKLALLNANKKSGGVLIVFGSDWCPPWRELDKLLDQIDVKNDLHPIYEIVKIDIGHWDKNMDIAKKYGNPVREGIPGIVLLNKDGTIREIIETKELSSLMSGGADVLMLYLQESWFFIGDGS